MRQQMTLEQTTSPAYAGRREKDPEDLVVFEG